MSALITSAIPFEIRSLSVDDAPAMFRIESLVHSHPMSLANLEDCFGHLYRVQGIYAADELLGFSIVQQIIDEVTLLDICVAPTAQGRGLGKQLLTELIAQAKVADAVVVMLEVRQSNCAAMGLYQQAGFVESGRRKGYYPLDDGREDAILMDLSL